MKLEILEQENEKIKINVTNKQPGDKEIISIHVENEKLKSNIVKQQKKNN